MALENQRFRAWIASLSELPGDMQEDDLIYVLRGATSHKLPFGPDQLIANLIAGASNDSKPYTRGNILGTVSQSGGVPTGAIIERDSNSDGEYTRLADGTQICWRIHAGTSTSTSAVSVNLAATFASIQYANAIDNSSGNGANEQSGSYFSIRAQHELPKASSGTVVFNYQSAYQTRLTETAFVIAVFAVGRWF